MYVNVVKSKINGDSIMASCQSAMSANKEHVTLALVSFLLVTLICGFASMHIVFADVKKGPIGCTPNKNPGNVAKPGLITCCQTTTDSEGIETTKCTVCDDTQPPSNCTRPFTPREGSGASNIGTVQPPYTPPWCLCLHTYNKVYTVLYI